MSVCGRKETVADNNLESVYIHHKRRTLLIIMVLKIQTNSSKSAGKIKHFILRCVAYVDNGKIQGDLPYYGGCQQEFQVLARNEK